MFTRLERAVVQQTMARTRSATGNLPKDKEPKVNVEDMKEKLEAQLKIQRAAHQQKRNQTSAATSNSDSSKTTQHVIKLVPNSSGI